MPAGGAEEIWGRGTGSPPPHRPLTKAPGEAARRPCNPGLECPPRPPLTAKSWGTAPLMARTVPARQARVRSAGPGSPPAAAAAAGTEAEDEAAVSANRSSSRLPTGEAAASAIARAGQTRAPARRLPPPPPPSSRSARKASLRTTRGRGSPPPNSHHQPPAPRSAPRGRERSCNPGPAQRPPRSGAGRQLRAPRSAPPQPPRGLQCPLRQGGELQFRPGWGSGRVLQSPVAPSWCHISFTGPLYLRRLWLTLLGHQRLLLDWGPEGQIT